jgi:ankyrin repeat protein
MVELLIKHGASVDSSTQSLDTALHKAAEFGHLDVLNSLLSHGATVNAKNRQSQTALHLAAMNGHGEIVSQLLSKLVSSAQKFKMGNSLR